MGIDCDKVVFTVTGSDQTYKRLNNIGNKEDLGIHKTLKKLIEIYVLMTADMGISRGIERSIPMCELSDHPWQRVSNSDRIDQSYTPPIWSVRHTHSELGVPKNRING